MLDERWSSSVNRTGSLDGSVAKNDYRDLSVELSDKADEKWSGSCEVLAQLRANRATLFTLNRRCGIARLCDTRLPLFLNRSRSVRIAATDTYNGVPDLDSVTTAWHKVQTLANASHQAEQGD